MKTVGAILFRFFQARVFAGLSFRAQFLCNRMHGVLRHILTKISCLMNPCAINLRICHKIGLWSVLALAGCTVGPDFHRPDSPAVHGYTANTDVLPAGRSLVLGQQAAAQWWTLFSNPALNALLQQAVRNNHDLAAAKQTLAQAKQTVLAQQGMLLPQAGLSAVAGRQKYGVALFGPSNFLIPPFSYIEVGPNISWDADLFGAGRRSVEYQAALADYQAREVDAVYVILTGNVVNAALELAATKAELTTCRQIVARDEALLNLVRVAMADGSATQVEVLHAQARLLADRAQLPALNQRLNVSRHTLAILVGNMPAVWAPPDFALRDFTLPRRLPVSLPSTLVRQRPDILAAEDNLHAASAAIGVATAKLYPDITLSADILQEALTPAGLLQSVNNAWALAGSVTAPLFSGGTLTAQKRAAEHGYQAALAQYRQTILLAFGQVADALTALAQDETTLAEQQKTMDIAKATRGLVRAGLSDGSNNQVQEQEAERELAVAQRGWVQSQYAYDQDAVRLFVALGAGRI